jgi:hypothetical protein
MSEIFKMTRDEGGYNGFGLPFTEDNYNVILPDNVTQISLIIPSNYQYWFMIARAEIGAIIYAARNENIVQPTTSTFVKNGTTLNPGPTLVFAGDTINFMGGLNTTLNLGVTLYAIQSL